MAEGCPDTLTLKGYDDSSFDGCYLALADGYDHGGLTNPYFLAGVSNVDAYLVDVDGYLTESDLTESDLAESDDEDFGPVIYIDSTPQYNVDSSVSQNKR